MTGYDFPISSINWNIKAAGEMETQTSNGAKQPAVLIRRTKAALHLILNRPEAINSLTFEMLLVIADEIAKAGSTKP